MTTHTSASFSAYSVFPGCIASHSFVSPFSARAEVIRANNAKPPYTALTVAIRKAQKAAVFAPHNGRITLLDSFYCVEIRLLPFCRAVAQDKKRLFKFHCQRPFLSSSRISRNTLQIASSSLSIKSFVANPPVPCICRLLFTFARLRLRIADAALRIPLVEENVRGAHDSHIGAPTERARFKVFHLLHRPFSHRSWGNSGENYRSV